MEQSKYVEDYALAQIAMVNHPNLPPVSASFVIQADRNNQQLVNLVNILGLPVLDRDRILRILEFMGKLDNGMQDMLMNFDIQSILDLLNTNLKMSESELYAIKSRVTEITGFDTSNFTVQRLKSLCNIYMHDKCLLLAGVTTDGVSFIVRRGKLYPFDAETRTIDAPIPIPDRVVKVSKGNVNVALTEDGVVYIDGYFKYNSDRERRMGHSGFHFARSNFSPINQRLFGDEKIVDILCDGSSILFLTESGLVYG